MQTRAETPDELIAFAGRFRAEVSRDKPLAVMPTACPQATEDEFAAAGVNIVIYANHLLRAAYPAMRRTAESILANGRAQEADAELCMSTAEVAALT